LASDERSQAINRGIDRQMTLGARFRKPPASDSERNQSARMGTSRLIPPSNLHCDTPSLVGPGYAFALRLDRTPSEKSAFAQRLHRTPSQVPSSATAALPLRPRTVVSSLSPFSGALLPSPCPTPTLFPSACNCFCVPAPPPFTPARQRSPFPARLPHSLFLFCMALVLYMIMHSYEYTCTLVCVSVLVSRSSGSATGGAR